MAWKENWVYTILLYLGFFVILTPFCRGAELTRIKVSEPSVALKLKLRENSTLINGQGKEASTSDVHHGKLILARNSRQGVFFKERKSANNLLNVHADYQSDVGWEIPEARPDTHGRTKSRPDGATVDQLLQMEPTVECTGHSMKLKVRNAESVPGSLFFVDRGSRLSPLPLSKLPPSCGYTMMSTLKELVLVAPYDGCFVMQEEDQYVLPLRWCEFPVRMSCPVMKPSSPNPPMVTCHSEGMVVKLEWAISIENIRMNLSGRWEPLMTVSSKCGFSVVSHPEGVVLSARYAPCLEMKDGMFTIELTGEGEIQVSCPLQPVPDLDDPLRPKPTQWTTTQTKRVVYPWWSPHSVPSTLAPHQTPRTSLAPHQTPYNPHPQAPQYPIVPNWLIPHQPQQPEEPGKPGSAFGPMPTPAVQQPSYPYPFYPWPPQPKNPHKPEPVPNQPERPASVPQLPATEAPKGQAHYPYPNWPHQPQHVPKQPERPASVTQLPATEAPKGQAHYPYPNWPHQPQPAPNQPERPASVTQPPATEVPKGQVPFYPYPFYPQQPQIPKSPPVTKPSNPSTEETAPAMQGPMGQVHLPFYPYPFYPQQPQIPMPETSPLNPSAIKPGPATQPPASKAPSHAVHPDNLHQNPQPSPASVAQLPATEAPKGQAHYPYPPYPNWPHQPQHVPNQPERPASVTQPPATEVPKGQVPFYPYPFYPQQPQIPKSPPVTKPSNLSTEETAPATQGPMGQVHLPFYPYPFYPQQPQIPMPVTSPLNPAAIKPGPATQPPATEAPSQAVHPYNLPQNPQPSPASVAQLPATEAPKGQAHYPYPNWPHQPQPAPNQPERPASVTQPPASEAPSHAVHPYNLPQNPQSAATPPVPSVHCPMFCPSGVSDCCPSISFHQHHHHIVPAGLTGDGMIPMYPGFPFLPASGYSISGYGKEPAPLSISHPQQSEATKALPQPTEASTTTSEERTTPPDNYQKGFGGYWSHTASPSLPFGSQPEMQPYFQPGSYPIAPPVSDPNKPMHPFMFYNLQYPKWPYEQLPGKEHSSPPRTQVLTEGPQTHLIAQPQAFPTKPSNPQAPVSDPMLPNYQVSDLQPLMPHGQESSGPGPPQQPYFMPYVPQHPKDSKQSQQPPAMDPQSPVKGLGEPEHPVHQYEGTLFNPPLVPYHMLQDHMLQDSHVLPNSKPSGNLADQPFKPQPPVGDSKKPSKTKGDSPMNQYHQPNGYVLLQHGPPVSEPNRPPGSLLPATDPNDSSGPQRSTPVYDPNVFLDLDPPWHGSGKPQNLQEPQSKLQPPEHLGMGTYGDLPDDGASITTEGYGLPSYYPAPPSPNHLSMPQKPLSLPPKSLKPEFPQSLKDYWKPVMLSGSRYRSPPPYPGLPSKGQDFAIDDQPEGYTYQPIQRNSGHRKLN